MKSFGDIMGMINEVRETKKSILNRAKDSDKHRITTGKNYIAITDTRRNGVQIKFWEDGKITRGDVSLEIAQNMTVSQASKSLFNN